MKRLIAITIFLLVIAFSIVFLNTKAKDLSSNITISNIHFCSDSSCTTEYTETNGVVALSTFLIKFDWQLTSPTPISEGDIITIPLGTETISETTTTWQGNFAWSDINDQNGNKVGRWRLVDQASANHRIEIELSDNAVGKTSLSGTLITSKNIRSNYSYVDIVVPLTVGNTVKRILINKNNFTENTSDNPSINSSFASNSTVYFGITTPYTAIRQLYRYNEYSTLTDSAKMKDFVCYLSLPPGFTAKRTSIYARAVLPTDITNHYAASNELIAAYTTNDFILTEQNTNETFEAFQNRLSKYHYGFYKDASGNVVSVINFGNIPSDDYTYHGILGENPGDRAYKNNKFTVNQQVRDIANRALGPNNIIRGKVPMWTIVIQLDYPTVNVETPKTSTATCTYKKINGERVNYQATATNNLTPATSITIINGTSQFYLYDEDNRQPLNNVRIKLEKKVNSTTWTSIGETTTDSNGKASFMSLEDGEYRYSQINYLDHYVQNSLKMYSNSSFSNNLTTFTISGNGNVVYATNKREQLTVTYKKGEHGNFSDQTYNVLYNDPTPVYTPSSVGGWDFVKWNPEFQLTVKNNIIYTALWEKKVNLTKHYYLEGTTNKIKADEIEIVKVGENYSTSKTPVANKYQYVSTQGNESGVVPDSDIEISYYYKLKSSVLTVKYLEEGTNNILAPTITRNLKYDDPYETTPSSAIPKNYNFKRVVGTPSGTVESDTINVIYYYEKKNSTINDSITKSGTDLVEEKNDELSFQIKYNVKLNDYIGDGTITIIDTLPYEIDINNSLLDGGVYNNKTITWTQSLNNIDTYDGEDSITITKNIKIVYSNLDSKQRAMTNTIKGRITLDNNSSEVTNTFNTDINIKGKVIIHYKDDENNEIIAPIEKEDLVGTIIVSEYKEFEGYYLLKQPENETVEITDDNQEIIYLYKKYVYNIETEASSGGQIKGNEAVKYGDDSTPNNIIIEADKNYCINTIKVNGESIKVKACKRQVLENFKNVKDNKKIQVTFKLQNPKTFTLFCGIIVIISILLTVLIYFINNKKIKALKI